MRREWNYLYDMAFIGFMVSDSGPSLSDRRLLGSTHTAAVHSLSHPRIGVAFNSLQESARETEVMLSVSSRRSLASLVHFPASLCPACHGDSLATELTAAATLVQGQGEARQGNPEFASTALQSKIRRH